MIRKDYPGLPVVLTSGYAQETFRSDFAVQAISFLTKPYRLKDLVTEIERLMGSGA